VKHSKASRIEIELEENESNLTLAIRDNGVGLADPLPTGRGMGLKIVQYRAAMINGSMAFKARSDGGTTVICTVKKSGAQP
jgi:nitrate/nitrite-specific signal transduction histidine kinase